MFLFASFIVVAWMNMMLIGRASAAASAGSKPHLMYILADDFGWADADWHRPAGWKEAATPHMMELLKAGVELDNMHAFKFCAPTRSSIQSGRNPIHVNVQNYQPVVWDSTDPKRDKVSGYAGIPTKMTGMSAVLKGAGYATHYTGKWDCGMATEEHTPKGRGYDTSLFYFHHDNDYWTERVRASDAQQLCPGQDHQLVDLWNDAQPGRGLNNSAELCELGKNHTLPYPVATDGKPNPACIYEDDVFLHRVTSTIEAHDPSIPLFFFWAAHTIHAPLQVPKLWYDRYAHVDDARRRKYLAMVNWLDTAISKVTGLLKTKQMYDSTLIVFSSDNGGPIYFGGNSGANNFPLRGGKASNWQGGIRVNSFVSGGALPAAMHGKKLEGLTCVWDIYATFAHLAGADPTDHAAAAAGLPPVDSINLWSYLSGESATSPRKRIPIGSTTCEGGFTEGCINQWGWGDVKTIVQGLIEDRGSEGIWKLLTGANPMNGWQGPLYPNATSNEQHAFSFRWIHDCKATGCLFNLSEDATVDKAEIMPTVAKDMLATLQKLNESTFSPYRGPGEQNKDIAAACSAAVEKYGGFFGPFVDV